MPRHAADPGTSNDVVKKKVAQAKAADKKKQPRTNGHQLPKPIPFGEILTDVTKKQWIIGKSIGKGGFGEIYLASDDVSRPVTDNVEFVIKIEPHNNGPLFTEMHFYHKVAKTEMIQEWMVARRSKSLGMPKFISFGSHVLQDSKYRFLVMDRFGSDLQKRFEQNNKRFAAKTVFTLGIQIMDVLEYIHSKGYVHVDIKASNLLLGLRNEDVVYLVDYGLAFKYMSEGRHKPYVADPRRAHDGTIEFTSRDAHVGAFSRRGDLEVLGYNMVQWLCGRLPWEDNIKDPVYVMAQKNGFMSSIPSFMAACFKTKTYPAIESYLKYICSLGFEQQPDYDYCKKIFLKGLKSAQAINDGRLELGRKNSSPKHKQKAVANKVDDENLASDVPAKKPRSETVRQPCGVAQTNRVRRSPRSARKGQEPEKMDVGRQKLDVPTPEMLHVMQLREEKARQKMLAQKVARTKKSASGRSVASKEAPSSASSSQPDSLPCTRVTRQRLRLQSDVHSSTDDSTNGLSPEMF